MVLQDVVNYKSRQTTVSLEYIDHNNLTSVCYRERSKVKKRKRRLKLEGEQEKEKFWNRIYQNVLSARDWAIGITWPKLRWLMVLTFKVNVWKWSISGEFSKFVWKKTVKIKWYCRNLFYVNKRKIRTKYRRVVEDLISK